MTLTIPRSEIIKCYLRPFSAEQTAYALNCLYRENSLFTRPISKRDVERIWEEELEINPLLRQLGDRPEYGFPPSDKLELAETLMVAA